MRGLMLAAALLVLPGAAAGWTVAAPPAPSPATLVRDAVDNPQSREFLDSFRVDAIRPLAVPPGKRVFLTNSLTIAETGGNSTYRMLRAIRVRWQQTGGPAVTIDKARDRAAAFVAPDRAGVYDFTVTLTNRSGARSGTLSVTVDPALPRE